MLAVAFMVLLANDIQAVFWIAVIPAFISVAILIFAVKEPEMARSVDEVHAPIYGPSSTFFAGAGIMVVALAGLVTLQGSGHSLRTKDEE